MNKILPFIFVIFLFVLAFTSSALSFFISLILLLAIGITLSFIQIRKVTKSNVSVKSKIYFSFIFSFLIFFSIQFFWTLGKNPLLDAFGLAGMFIAVALLVCFFVCFILGIVLSIKNKNSSEYSYNKTPVLISTVLVVILLILFFYNSTVFAVSKVSRNENFCDMSLSLSDNSAMFHTSHKKTCFVELAAIKLDVSICQRSNADNYITGCYIKVATLTNSTDICKKGVDEGVEGMDTCFSLVDGKTSIRTRESMIDLVKICENNQNQCGNLSEYEEIILDTLKDSQNSSLSYVITATKYLGPEGQQEKVIPLLRNLLTTASLIDRKASMDSLLYIVSTMDFQMEKQELKLILPLIENQPSLENYIQRVKSRLSANVIPPSGQ